MRGDQCLGKMYEIKDTEKCTSFKKCGKHVYHLCAVDGVCPACMSPLVDTATNYCFKDVSVVHNSSIMIFRLDFGLCGFTI